MTVEPIPIDVDGEEFAEIASWEFGGPHQYVSRVLN